MRVDVISDMPEIICYFVMLRSLFSLLGVFLTLGS